jgi:hypothetical protein
MNEFKSSPRTRDWGADQIERERVPQCDGMRAVVPPSGGVKSDLRCENLLDA